MVCTFAQSIPYQPYPKIQLLHVLFALQVYTTAVASECLLLRDVFGG